MKADRIARLLQETQLFEDLEEPILLEVAERCNERSYKRGQLIFHQGDPGEALYIVVEGLVKVFVPSSEGEEMVLVTLGPSEVFGELALIDGGTRSASAEAAAPTTLISLTRTTHLQMVRDHPALMEALLRSLGRTIRRLTEQAADLVFLDLHGRVAKLLTSLADDRGEKVGDTVVLDLNLTQTDLARMVGGSRQSVNQILRSFESREYLTLHGKTIELKEPELLRRRAGL